MKKLALGLLLLGGVTAHAQDEQMVLWMKATGKAADTLRKMEKKTGEAAVENAELMGGVYERMIGFWRQRGAADAVKLSEEGKAAAVVLASAAHSGDEAKAAEALKTLGGTCKPCHEAHRERIAEGKYRIK